MWKQKTCLGTFLGRLLGPFWVFFFSPFFGPPFGPFSGPKKKFGAFFRGPFFPFFASFFVCGGGGLFLGPFFCACCWVLSLSFLGCFLVFFLLVFFNSPFLFWALFWALFSGPLVVGAFFQGPFVRILSVCWGDLGPVDLSKARNQEALHDHWLLTTADTASDQDKGGEAQLSHRLLPEKALRPDTQEGPRPDTQLLSAPK